MIAQSDVDYFKEVGIWYTGIKAEDPSEHISCLRQFLSREVEYKNRFLQKKMKKVFDGYSFLGQEDSLNQGSDDHVYSYVLSDFASASIHPFEFASLSLRHLKIEKTIVLLEETLLNKVDPSLTSLYEKTMGHMLSANYYPKSQASKLRLTAHPDVSLLTVFPFGIDEEFQFELPDGTWQTIEKTDEIICFSGYLLEFLTGIKALNHKVEKKGPQSERYSFAYFSIPRPNQTFQHRTEKVTSEEYFARYLSLFD